MEIPSGRWPPTELGIDEDPGFNILYPMSPLDHWSIDDPITFQSFFSTSNDHQNFNPQTKHNNVSLERNPQTGGFERPEKQLKRSHYPSSQIISFKNSGSSGTATSQKLHSLAKKEEPCGGNMNYQYPVVSLMGSLDEEYGLGCYGEGNKKIGVMRRNPLLAKEHVEAERKRREKLTQGFISLSAVVPGLKKTDKASVLGGAVKYLKHLEERLESLEEQAARRTMESAVFVKRSHVYIDDESSSTDDRSDGDLNQLLLPEIEARVSDKNVLIRIHCKKRNGYLQKILCEIEKLHLNVVNSSALPFGNSILDVTIVAQMDVDFSTTAKDVVRNLRKALV